MLKAKGYKEEYADTNGDGNMKFIAGKKFFTHKMSGKSITDQSEMLNQYLGNL